MSDIHLSFVLNQLCDYCIDVFTDMTSGHVPTIIK